MEPVIDPDDRATYAEAEDITGRTHSYLRQQAVRRDLTRIGGQRHPPATFMSCARGEAVALQRYRRGSRYGLLGASGLGIGFPRAVSGESSR